jgi:hypothetical protein
MRKRWRTALLAIGVLAVGSGTSEISSAANSVPARPTGAGSSTATIVGRWEQVHTCQQLVRSLKKVNLLPLAPGVVGDYFPDKTPQQLARKAHICQGAKPQRHSHFFTRDGRFGSVDQHGQQVDDGTYRLIDARTFSIENPDVSGSFHYRIAHRKVLTLRPVITSQMRQEALAHPLEFSAAGWAVAVSYIGLPWHRVPCRQWC